MAIDRDSFTEVLELEKLDDKLISLYQNLIDFKYGKVLIFKGELEDAQFQAKYTDLSFLNLKGILEKYEYLKKDEKNKCIDYEILESYIYNIYLDKEDSKVES